MLSGDRDRRRKALSLFTSSSPSEADDVVVPPPDEETLPDEGLLSGDAAPTEPNPESERPIDDEVWIWVKKIEKAEKKH